MIQIKLHRSKLDLKEMFIAFIFEYFGIYHVNLLKW